MIKISIVVFTIFLILLESCTIPKDARILKRSTKEWRESEIVFDAWADTPLYGIFLTLRKNGKFEFTSSGFLKSFEAGSWTNFNDTIKLVYSDSKQNIIKYQNVLIDRQTSTLVFENDSIPPQFRLKIITNKLNSAR